MDNGFSNNTAVCNEMFCRAAYHLIMLPRTSTNQLRVVFIRVLHFQNSNLTFHIRLGLYTELCYVPCSRLFAVLLPQQVVTFWMLFFPWHWSTCRNRDGIVQPVRTTLMLGITSVFNTSYLKKWLWVLLMIILSRTMNIYSGLWILSMQGAMCSALLGFLLKTPHKIVLSCPKYIVWSRCSGNANHCS